MKKYSILFFLRQSLHGLIKNSIMSITSIFFLTLCLIVTGCSILLVLNADLNLRQLDNFNKIIFRIDTNYPALKSMDIVDKEKLDAFINLAYGEMKPLDFMEKFPGEITGDNPSVYVIDLPKEYKVRIEYNDDAVKSVWLEDYYENAASPVNSIEINAKTEKSAVNDFMVDRIKKQIAAMDNVKVLKFVSNDDAYEQFRDEYDAFADILEDRSFEERVLKANPLSHSIEIEYRDIDYVSTLVADLEAIDDGAHRVRNHIEIADFIRSLRSIVMLVLIGFMIILFVSAVFIILNMVRLSVHSRKQEIIIMRYIGATNFFILFPFLLEGIIIGVVSSIAAFIAQWYIYSGAMSAINDIESGFKFVAFSEVNIMLFTAFLLTGVICGLLGSGLSSRRYLQA